MQAKRVAPVRTQQQRSFTRETPGYPRSTLLRRALPLKYRPRNGTLLVDEVQRYYSPFPPLSLARFARLIGSAGSERARNIATISMRRGSISTVRSRLIFINPFATTIRTESSNPLIEIERNKQSLVYI